MQQRALEQLLPLVLELPLHLHLQAAAAFQGCGGGGGLLQPLPLLPSRHLLPPLPLLVMEWMPQEGRWTQAGGTMTPLLPQTLMASRSGLGLPLAGMASQQQGRAWTTLGEGEE